MALLEVKGIRKNFGEVEVLKGIDFDLEQGEVLTIIGSSGSGKTTLLRCLNYLETADAGTVDLDGENVFDGNDKEKHSAEDIRQKRLKFGMVFQSFNLFPHYNVLKNITIAPELKLKEELEKEKKALKKELGFKKTLAIIKEKKAEGQKNIQEEAVALLERVGLGDKLKAYPCELSGGQQQRVAIARALALRPTILCFDEPTSALDPELTGEVLKVIRELRNEGRTMIIVTHEMAFAKSVSDKIMFMSQGVVAEYGTPEEVFDNPTNPATIAFINGISNE